MNMEPFAEFLIAMGYPADKIRNPRDGRTSESSFIDSRQLAGMVAWYYETEGMPPVLIGHSKGGALVISVLYELAGEFSDSIHVWNPLTDQAEPRKTIVDPATGEVRPVVGLRIRYAAALATGKLPRLLTGQWSLLSRLRRIPDSVDDFTGFSIEWDLIAGDFGRLRALHGDRDRSGAQRHASGRVHAHRASRASSTSPRTPSRVHGSTRTFPAPRIALPDAARRRYDEPRSRRRYLAQRQEDLVLECSTAAGCKARYDSERTAQPVPGGDAALACAAPLQRRARRAHRSPSRRATAVRADRRRARGARPHRAHARRGARALRVRRRTEPSAARGRERRRRSVAGPAARNRARAQRAVPAATGRSCRSALSRSTHDAGSIWRSPTITGSPPPTRSSC